MRSFVAALRNVFWKDLERRHRSINSLRLALLATGVGQPLISIVSNNAISVFAGLCDLEVAMGEIAARTGPQCGTLESQTYLIHCAFSQLDAKPGECVLRG